jgi:hypothetical protein
MSAPSPTLDHSLAVCDILLEAATPELYRNNAFRVLGLPVDTTPREVTRRGEELAMARRYGNGQACRKGAMPLGWTAVCWFCGKTDGDADARRGIDRW